MSGENFDIFISYRRSDGTDKARMITETLKGKNYRCFLDFDRLKGGKFDDKIYQAIKDAPIFIAVMTPDYLVRQKKDKEEENQNEDWVYKEIEFAKENGKYIITINYNKQIESIPNEVPANISQALGAHTFVEVHDGQTYESNMENLIKGWISEVLPPPSFRSEKKANIEVFSDCDCNILKANEVIATVSKQGYNIIKLRQGRHRLICQSSQFSDIQQEQILTVNESLADDFFKIELANQVQERKKAIAQEQKAEKDAIKHRQDEEKRREEEKKRREEEKEKRKQKRKEWWERNKRKLLITLAVIFGIAIIIGLNNSSLGETETPTETATETITKTQTIIPVVENVTSINNNEDSIRKAEEQKKEEERKLKEEQKKKKRDEEKKKRDEEKFKEYKKKGDDYYLLLVGNPDNKDYKDQAKYYYGLALQYKEDITIRNRFEKLKR